MIIGLSGTNSSGKDTVAEYLQGAGFAVVSLSDILRDEMRKRGIEINRENMIETGNLLEEEWGAGSLAKIAIKEYGNKRKLVISSIRKLAEIDFLKKNPDFKFIFVDALIEMRYERILKRKREGEEKITLEEFKRQEEIEMSGQGSQNLGYCKEKAEIQIDNSGTLGELYHKIEGVIEKEAKLS